MIFQPIGLKLSFNLKKRVLISPSLKISKSHNSSYDTSKAFANFIVVLAL